MFSQLKFKTKTKALSTTFSTDLTKQFVVRKLRQCCDGRTGIELLIGRDLLPGGAGAAGGVAGHTGGGGGGAWALTLPVHAVADV